VLILLLQDTQAQHRACPAYMVYPEPCSRCAVPLVPERNMCGVARSPTAANPNITPLTQHHKVLSPRLSLPLIIVAWMNRCIIPMHVPGNKLPAPKETKKGSSP
jgi:hypothetical protein